MCVCVFMIPRAPVVPPQKVFGTLLAWSWETHVSTTPTSPRCWDPPDHPGPDRGGSIGPDRSAGRRPPSGVRGELAGRRPPYGRSAHRRHKEMGQELRRWVDSWIFEDQARPAGFGTTHILGVTRLGVVWFVPRSAPRHVT